MSSGTAEPFTGHPFGSADFRRIRLALPLAALATFAMLYGIQPLLPTLTHDFALTPAEAAMAMSLPAAAVGITMLFAGPLSEVVGRTVLIHSSLVATATLGILSAFAPTWGVFLAVRTVQGATLAGVAAVALAYLSEEVSRDSLARAAGLYVAGSALGGMSGRFLAGGLTQLAGWRWASAGLGAAGLACAVTVLLVLPKSQGFTPAPADIRHLMRAGWAVLRDPGTVVLFCVGCLGMGTFVGLFNAVVFRLEGPEYGLSVAMASSVFIVHLVGSWSSALGGKLADRLGYRVVAPLTATLLLAGVLLTTARPLPVLILALAMASAGFFATHGLAQPWVAVRASLGAAGTAQATAGYVFSCYLGSSVIGALVPALWASGGWPAVVWICAGLVAVTSALLLLMRRIPEPPREAQPPRPAAV